MIGIEKRSSKQTNSINQELKYARDISLPLLSKRKFAQKNLLPIYNKSIVNQNIQSPKYSDSFISNVNLSKGENDSIIHSNDRHDSSSSSSDNLTIDSRPRTQLTNLQSLDFVQSSANFIYPTVRIKSSGYFFNQKHIQEQNSIYLFSNRFSYTKNMPLVFLGSEYFLRKPINSERLKFPLSSNEQLEPLVDLFLTRPQFVQEIPELTDLSNYLILPRSISALAFFDSPSRSSSRHLCHELRSKENQNKFTIKDLSNMSQRENHIIQVNAINDQRYHALIKQLTDTYSPYLSEL